MSQDTTPSTGQTEHPPAESPQSTPGLAVKVAVPRAVFTLAIPVLAEQFLNSLVGITDVYLAGRLSVDATAAIGLAAYVAWLISMLFMLVGTGTTALVARFTGSAQPDRANHFANQSLGLAVAMGLAAVGLVYVLAPVFANLQNMTGTTYDIVVRYLRIDGAAHVFTSVTLIGSAALRGVGDMRTPLKILSVVNIANLIISCTLVFGLGPIPPLGVDGIVIGTVAGRVIGGLLTINVLLKGRSGLKITADSLRPDLASTQRILHIGGPAALDGAVMWSGHFVYLMIIANLAEGHLGQAYYAAHIIGVRIEALTYLPAVAWAAATATIVGQSLGANDPRRAVSAGHQAVLQCSVLAVALVAFYYFGADFIFRIMHKDELVQQVGPPAFRMLAFFQIFLTTSIIYVGALRGAGDTRVPLLITIIGVGFVRLPIGYFFGIVLGKGLIGAWMGMCADMVVRALLAALRFTRAKWIHTRV
ncbi:MAG: MATE family efflux transporter [Phycisphaerae bacterium]